MTFSKIIIYFLNWDSYAKRIVLLFFYPWTIYIHKSLSSLKGESLKDLVVLSFSSGKRARRSTITRGVIIFLLGGRVWRTTYPNQVDSPKKK